MRQSFIVLIAVLAACSDSTTKSPALDPVESAALLERPASVTLVTTNTQKPTTPPTIAAIRDSIVLRASEAPVCGGARANAGMSGGTVVVTLTITEAFPQNCMVVNGNLVYTATVTGVAAGAHDVVFTQETIAGPDTARTVLARGRVELP